MKLLGKKDKTKKDTKQDAAPSAAAGAEHVMTRINLLPWRVELRKERAQRFGAITGVCLLIAGLVFLGVHLYVERTIDYHKARNTFLEEEIKKAEEKIKEIEKIDEEMNKLIQRMEVISQLQSSRPEIVHIFEQLVTTLPEGVYYTSFTQKDRQIALEGIAQSGARVSRLMRNMDDSEWFHQPTLVQTKRVTKNGQELHEFSLKVGQKPRKKGEDEDDAEEAGSTSAVSNRGKSSKRKVKVKAKGKKKR